LDGGIQKDINRFCSFYDQIQRRNESGKNDNDKVKHCTEHYIMITYHVIYTNYELIIPLQLKDTLQIFQGIVGSSFSYIHCWCMLRHDERWNDWLASLTQMDKEATVTANPAEQTS
jgi:hypothetical protein